MIAAGLNVFDRTLHTTYDWLADLMRALAVDDRQVAYQALRATLHTLRDRMTVEEVAQLGAQLPMLVRGFYYEGWDPTGKPVKVRHKEQFLACIASEFSNDDVDPEQAARAVFALLAKRVTTGEIEDVKHILPAAVRELWP
jgi:uncharacterized protein (DUF2267 family)